MIYKKSYNFSCLSKINNPKMIDEFFIRDRRIFKPEDWRMRFEDFKIMDWEIKDEEEEILNAGLTPCSHTTTT